MKMHVISPVFLIISLQQSGIIRRSYALSTMYSSVSSFPSRFRNNYSAHNRNPEPFSFQHRSRKREAHIIPLTMQRSFGNIENICRSKDVDERSMMRAALDRIRQCNNVPRNVRSMLLDFVVDGRILGKITSINAIKLCETRSVTLASPVFQMVERTSDDQRQHHQQKHPQYLTLTTAAGSTCQSRTDAVMAVMDNLRASGIVKGWRDELLPVSSDFYASPTFLIERAAAPILGVQQYGVHVNGIVKQHGKDDLMWMARRSKSKSKFPGMLDHIVAGGQPAGISLTDNVIKECMEEAGIPREMTLKCFQPTGAISYESYDTDRLGFDDDGSKIANKVGSGLISRSVLFCYDLILPKDFIPKPNDGEVEDFFIWTMDQVMESMKMEYHDPIKPNCYPVIIDYLLRTGYLSPETPGYLDVLRELRGGYCG